jgi:hypothetical protein
MRKRRKAAAAGASSGASCSPAATRLVGLIPVSPAAYRKRMSTRRTETK